MFLVTRSDFPAGDLMEIAAYAKANPTGLSPRRHLLVGPRRLTNMCDSSSRTAR
jgi:hypothetical protein